MRQLVSRSEKTTARFGTSVRRTCTSPGVSAFGSRPLLGLQCAKPCAADGKTKRPTATAASVPARSRSKRRRRRRARTRRAGTRRHGATGTARRRRRDARRGTARHQREHDKEPPSTKVAPTPAPRKRGERDEHEGGDGDRAAAAEHLRRKPVAAVREQVDLVDDQDDP